MSFQILSDDDDDLFAETLEMSIRFTGATDDIGRLLDLLSTQTEVAVQFDPPRWNRTFYGWDLHRG